MPVWNSEDTCTDLWELWISCWSLWSFITDRRGTNLLFYTTCFIFNTTYQKG